MHMQIKIKALFLYDLIEVQLICISRGNGTEDFFRNLDAFPYIGIKWQWCSTY